MTAGMSKKMHEDRTDDFIAYIRTGNGVVPRAHLRYVNFFRVTDACIADCSSGLNDSLDHLIEWAMDNMTQERQAILPRILVTIDPWPLAVVITVARMIRCVTAALIPSYHAERIASFLSMEDAEAIVKHHGAIVEELHRADMIHLIEKYLAVTNDAMMKYALEGDDDRLVDVCISRRMKGTRIDDCIGTKTVMNMDRVRLILLADGMNMKTVAKMIAVLTYVGRVDLLEIVVKYIEALPATEQELLKSITYDGVYANTYTLLGNIRPHVIIIRLTRNHLTLKEILGWWWQSLLRGSWVVGKVSIEIDHIVLAQHISATHIIAMMKVGEMPAYVDVWNACTRSIARSGGGKDTYISWSDLVKRKMRKMVFTKGLTDVVVMFRPTE